MPAEPRALPVRRREIFGWAMFDFANSSYTTVIVTVAYSIYFTKLVAPGRSADWLWGLGLAIANALVVATSPILGAIADGYGRKKAYLAATYVVCIAGTAALYFVTPGRVALGIALFVLSNLGYSLGENLSGAFLPEISTPRTVGRISGFGWGLGYLGGLGCLLLVQPLLAGGFDLANLDRLRLAWPLTAAFFLVAALPTFALLRERAPRVEHRSPGDYARTAFRRLRATWRAVGHFRELRRFLGVFFVYSCGLMAVIAFAAIFPERNLGFSSGELVLLFMLLQISSAAGAVGFGLLQDRIGARLTIQLTLGLWIAVSIAAWACHSKTLFWGLAMAAGLGIGSLQSASRALIGLFSPPSKSGEFFGFWGLAGKAAYAVGAPFFGLLSSLFASQRVAVLANTAFFVAGLVLMAGIDEARGRAAAASWREG